MMVRLDGVHRNMSEINQERVKKHEINDSPRKWRQNGILYHLLWKMKLIMKEQTHRKPARTA